MDLSATDVRLVWKVCVRPSGPYRRNVSGFPYHEATRSLLFPCCDESPSQGYPPALNSPVPIYAPGSRDTRVKFLAQEHNEISPALTARFGVPSPNH